MTSQNVNLRPQISWLFLCIIITFVSSCGSCGSDIFFWCSYRKDTKLFTELILGLLSCQCVHSNNELIYGCRQFSPALETCLLTLFLMGHLALNWRVVWLKSALWRSSSPQTRLKKHTDWYRASPMPGNLLWGHQGAAFTQPSAAGSLWVKPELEKKIHFH